MVNKISRTLNLKAVVFKSRKKGFAPPDLHQVIKSAWNKAGTAADLLYPKAVNLGHTDRQCFINNLKTHTYGISFQFCSYLPGHFPPSMELNFTEKNVDIDQIPITDAAGNERQVVSVSHILAFGGVILIENVKGNGGIDLLESYCTHLVRDAKDEHHPPVHLYDATSGDLDSTIKQAGGAVAVELSLVQPNVIEGSVYADALTDLSESVGGADKVVVRWESSSHLATKAVKDAFEEADYNDALDRINIVLHNGDSISLSKFRIRKRVRVQAVNGNNPASNEIIKELRLYLAELMSISSDGSTIVTDKGRLSDAIAYTKKS